MFYLGTLFKKQKLYQSVTIPVIKTINSDHKFFVYIEIMLSLIKCPHDSQSVPERDNNFIY